LQRRGSGHLRLATGFYTATSDSTATHVTATAAAGHQDRHGENKHALPWSDRKLHDFSFSGSLRA
jgi:hypothetical protein